MKPVVQDLDDLRLAIDAIDDQLLALIQERIQLAREIGRRKQAGGQEITDSQRERSIIKRLDEQIRPGLSTRDIQAIYSVIFRLCRDVQES
ncbi:MAG: hypothetical protein GXO90_01050 [FCB group bacterium]|nr:hypothetical protein [FCB group bacterium]